MCKVNCLHCFLFCFPFFLYLLYNVMAKAYATHTISHPGGGSGVSSGRGNGNLIMTRACLLGFICALLCASTQRSRCDWRQCDCSFVQILCDSQTDLSYRIYICYIYTNMYVLMPFVGWLIWQLRSIWQLEQIKEGNVWKNANKGNHK